MSKTAAVGFAIVVLIIVFGALHSVSNQLDASGGSDPVSNFFRKYSDWLVLPPTSKPSASGGSAEPKTVVRQAPSPGNGASGGSSGSGTKIPVSEPPKPTPPPGFTVEQLSPYYGKVRLSNIDTVQSRFDTGGFTVSVDGSLTKPVNLTGWTLRSNKSDVVARIPQAVAEYTPYTQTLGDILAAPGDYVQVRTTKGPILNLRTNRCTGYFNQVYQFDFGLPGDCPPLYSRDELTTLSGRCQSYIGSFGGCRLPTSQDYAAVGNLDGGACRAFLDRFGYKGCYDRYAATEGFFHHEWRVWLDVTSLGMDLEHDRILLLDRSGLIASVYTY